MKESKRKRQELRRESMQAYLDGKPIGDSSLLKFAAMGEPRPVGIDECVSHLRGYAPIYERETLSALPEGTFGRAYANFLDENGIQHITYSPEMRERFRDDPYVMRVGMTHDIHHLLVGGDAGIAGETAVAAFQAAQGTLGTTGRAIWTVLRLALGYTKQRPGRSFRVWSNVWNGWRLGRKTPLLISHRLEDMFELPLEEVRLRVGLPRDPRTVGIRYTDEIDGKPVPIAVDAAMARPGGEKTNESGARQ